MLQLGQLCACVRDAFDLGYRQLALSGGEPLLYPFLTELLEEARVTGMKTTLTSNGMLATSRRWESLAPLVDVLAISIDGRPEEHDTIRRHAGAFDRTVANLPAIRASGVPFGFIFTLTQHNVDSLEFVIRLAHMQGARSVQVHPLAIHGRATKEMPDARPDAIELLAALAEAARLAAELGLAVHVDVLTAEQLLAYRDHIVPTRPVENLVDAAPVLVVRADATVVPFTHELSDSLALGSLNTAPLPLLAQQWLAAGHGDSLAEVCQRTWIQLSTPDAPPASYWYEEVAARSHQQQA
jgi:MoaA/NifB/PqqE/SkfB family radical SAM enzyme